MELAAEPVFFVGSPEKALQCRIQHAVSIRLREAAAQRLAHYGQLVAQLRHVFRLTVQGQAGAFEVLVQRGIEFDRGVELLQPQAL